MATPYIWRKLTDNQRAELLTWRQQHRRPWHWPPHRMDSNRVHFHLTAACYEHVPIIGKTPVRMDSFSFDLLNTVANAGALVLAWAVLPNHYHLLVHSENIIRVLFQLGRFHGRTSRSWNAEDQTAGRKVFHGA